MQVGVAGIVAHVAAQKTLASDTRENSAAHREQPLVSLNLCPATRENPRNDHSQIFPLNDDRLMLVWSEYFVNSPKGIMKGGKTSDDAPCRLTGKISQGAGRTWSERFTLQDSFEGRSVKQANLVRLASGDVLCFFTVWFGRDDRRIYVKRSRNNCESWSEPKQFSKPGGFFILDAGNIFTHSSGRIILPAYWSPKVWSKDEHFKAFCFFSDDEGMSWQESTNRIDVAGRGAMEPAIAERQDGSLLAILRTSLGKLHFAESTDRGTTWTNSAPSNLIAAQSEPMLRRIPNSEDLLLIWNNPAKVRSHGPRTPLSSAISKDDGKTWSNIKAIDDRKGFDLAYASAFFNEDEVLVTYYAHQINSDGGYTSSLMLKILHRDWFYR